MTKLIKLLCATLLVFGISAFAGAKDPLFVNLTTNNTHSAKMALTFAA